MLILVRHGQTAANRGGLLQGRVDLDLTELGVAQAQSVAAALALRPANSGVPAAQIDRVVSSPLTRARRTAELIAGRLGHEVVLDDRLVELDYGDWDQRPLSDVPADVWQQWRSDPGFAPPGGESLRAVSERAVRCAGHYIGESGTTVLVSHVSPIKAIVAWALGGDEALTWRMQLDVAAISRVGMRNGVAYLSSWNETAAVAN